MNFLSYSDHFDEVRVSLRDSGLWRQQIYLNWSEDHRRGREGIRAFVLGNIISSSFKQVCPKKKNPWTAWKREHPWEKIDYVAILRNSNKNLITTLESWIFFAECESHPASTENGDFLFSAFFALFFQNQHSKKGQETKLIDDRVDGGRGFVSPRNKTSQCLGKVKRMISNWKVKCEPFFFYIHHFQRTLGESEIENGAGVEKKGKDRRTFGKKIFFQPGPKR